MPPLNTNFGTEIQDLPTLLVSTPHFILKMPPFASIHSDPETFCDV